MPSPLALALMSPGGPTAPSGFGASPLAPTNVIGAYGQSQDAAEKNYEAKLQQQNAMWGGLAGLGSAGITAAPRLYSALNAGGSAAGANIAGMGAGDSLALAPGAGEVLGGSTVADALGGAGAAAGTDAAFAAGAPVAADLAATAAPAAADAAGMSIADLLPFLAAMFV